MEKKILLEGRKEDAKKRLLNKYPNNETSIDTILGIDPTGSKYIPYLEYVYNKFGSEYERDSDTLQYQYPFLSKGVALFHVNQNKITKEVIDEYLDQSDIPPVPALKISRAPKDIMSYENIMDLYKIMTYVDGLKSKTEREREAKEKVNTIYRDANYLVIEPLSHLASCYYGAGTKWCTTATDSDIQYKKYSRDGKLYYFIDLGGENEKLALYIPNAINSPVEVYDEQDIEVGLNSLKLEYEDLVPVINNLIKDKYNSNIYDNLIRFRNKEISKVSLVESDPHIVGVSGKTNKITLQFTVREYLDFFQNLIDEEKDYIEAVLGGTYRFYSFSQANIEFFDGNIFYGFCSDDTKDKLFNMLELVTFRYSSCYEYKTNDCYDDIAVLLEKLYPNKVNEIIELFLGEVENSMDNRVKSIIDDKLCELFLRHKVFAETCLTQYTISLNDLIKLYENLSVKKFSISQLFTYLGSDIELIDFRETQEFEYLSNLSSASFNDGVVEILNEIEKTIKRDVKDLDEYFELKDFIKNGGMEGDSYIQLPGDKYGFKVTNIDPKTNKVSIVFIRLGDLKKKTLTFTKKGFDTFLRTKNQDKFLD